MAKMDSRVDAYIEKAQPFAKPILEHLRNLVHQACPEVEETIKWGMPCFDYKGPFCSMASFKQHAVFGFWKAPLLNDPHRFLQERSAQGGEAMGHMGRIDSLDTLPPDKVLLDLLKQAKKLNDDGIKLPPKPKAEKKEIIVPEYFIQVLFQNQKAQDTFNNFSYSHKKEYVEWITEAKTEATRNKRMETAIEWMSEGKGRHWKYEKK
jgi:uncharacterized protein YdeI (YjbR/CyaY-like superfamily)